MSITMLRMGGLKALGQSVRGCCGRMGGMGRISLSTDGLEVMCNKLSARLFILCNF